MARVSQLPCPAAPRPGACSHYSRPGRAGETHCWPCQGNSSCHTPAGAREAGCLPSLFPPLFTLETPEYSSSHPLTFPSLLAPTCPRWWGGTLGHNPLQTLHPAPRGAPCKIPLLGVPCSWAPPLNPTLQRVLSAPGTPLSPTLGGVPCQPTHSPTLLRASCSLQPLHSWGSPLLLAAPPPQPHTPGYPRPPPRPAPLLPVSPGQRPGRTTARQVRGGGGRTLLLRAPQPAATGEATEKGSCCSPPTLPPRGRGDGTSLPRAALSPSARRAGSAALGRTRRSALAAPPLPPPSIGFVRPAAAAMVGEGTAWWRAASSASLRGQAPETVSPSSPSALVGRGQRAGRRSHLREVSALPRRSATLLWSQSAARGRRLPGTNVADPAAATASPRLTAALLPGANMATRTRLAPPAVALRDAARRWRTQLGE